MKKSELRQIIREEISRMLGSNQISNLSEAFDISAEIKIGDMVMDDMRDQYEVISIS